MVCVSEKKKSESSRVNQWHIENIVLTIRVSIARKKASDKWKSPSLVLFRDAILKSDRRQASARKKDSEKCKSPSLVLLSDSILEKAN